MDSIRLLLAEIEHDLRAHVQWEETALQRIEKILSGNGQPGLVRSQVSLEERLKSVESWKKWIIGVMVTVTLAAVASLLQMVITLLKHGGTQ